MGQGRISVRITFLYIIILFWSSVFSLWLKREFHILIEKVFLRLKTVSRYQEREITTHHGTDKRTFYSRF